MNSSKTYVPYICIDLIVIVVSRKIPHSPSKKEKKIGFRNTKLQLLRNNYHKLQTCNESHKIISCKNGHGCSASTRVLLKNSLKSYLTKLKILHGTQGIVLLLSPCHICIQFITKLILFIVDGVIYHLLWRWKSR